MIEKCFLCGGPDDRHRKVDAQMERVAAGEDIYAVADEFGYALVADMVRFWAEAYNDAFDGWWDRT